MKIVLAVLAVLADCVAANCAEFTPEQEGQYIAAAVKYGLTTVRAIATSADTTFPPPTLEVDPVQRMALEKTLKGYLTKRQQDQGSIIALKGSAEFIIDTSSVTFAATGVGLVPAAIFKATAQASSDAIFGAMEANAKENLQLYLKKNEPALLGACGCSYEQLQSKSPSAIKTLLDAQPLFFKEFDSMVGDDATAKAAGQALIIQSISELLPV